MITEHSSHRARDPHQRNRQKRRKERENTNTGQRALRVTKQQTTLSTNSCILHESRRVTAERQAPWRCCRIRAFEDRMACWGGESHARIRGGGSWTEATAKGTSEGSSLTHGWNGGEPRERPMPGVHATDVGLALPCVTAPYHAFLTEPCHPCQRTLWFFVPRVFTLRTYYCPSLTH